MLTKRRLNLRRNMNDRLAVAPPPRGEPSTTKLPALLSGASSNSSSKFSNDLAGRFFTDNSFAAHSRDKEREVEREAQRKAKQRAKATQNRRRRLEKEMAKEAARIEAMERKLRGVPDDARMHRRKRHVTKPSVLSPLDPNTRFEPPERLAGAEKPSGGKLGKRRAASEALEEWGQDDALSCFDGNDIIGGGDDDGDDESLRGGWAVSPPRTDGLDDVREPSLPLQDAISSSPERSPRGGAFSGDDDASDDEGSEGGYDDDGDEKYGARGGRRGSDAEQLEEKWAGGSSEEEEEGQTTWGEDQPEGVYDGDGNWFGDLGSYLTEQTAFEAPPDGQREPAGLEGVEPGNHAGNSQSGTSRSPSPSPSPRYNDMRFDREFEPGADEGLGFEDSPREATPSPLSSERSVGADPRDSPSSRGEAATGIQALVRGSIGRQRASIRRRRHHEKLARQKAATSIQSASRGRRDRRRVAAKRGEGRRLDEAAVRLQSWGRGRADRGLVRNLRSDRAHARRIGSAAVRIQAVARGRSDRLAASQRKEARKKIVPLSSLDPRGVARWIEAVGLTACCQNMLANHIDGAMLADPDLGDADLEELGIGLRLHRRRILTLVHAAVQSGVHISWGEFENLAVPRIGVGAGAPLAAAAPARSVPGGAVNLVHAPRPAMNAAKQAMPPASDPPMRDAVRSRTGTEALSSIPQAVSRGPAPVYRKAPATGGAPLVPSASRRLPVAKVRSPPPPQASLVRVAPTRNDSDEGLRANPQWSDALTTNTNGASIESDDDSDEEDFPADFEAEEGGESVTQLL